MKLKNVLFYLFIFVLVCVQISAQNTNPVVTDVYHSYNSGDGTITITYYVKDAEQDSVTISMFVFREGDINWWYSSTQLTGDIGTVSVSSTAEQKTIIWAHDNEHGGPPSGNNFIIRINANDEIAGGSSCPGTPTVFYSGKTYNTIQIGEQCWLEENLDVGIMIQGNEEMTDNGIIEKYCYNNDTSNCNIYGGLYQWDETMQYDTVQGVQGICPDGWHIPTLDDLLLLNYTANNDGNALKAIGQGTGFGAGTNTSGFSALLGGVHLNDGFPTFLLLNELTYIWSSSGTSPEAAFLALYYWSGSTIILDFPLFPDRGISVRCVTEFGRTASPPEPTLYSPSTGATNVALPPTLIWNSSLGADSYTLQVSTSDQFTSFVYNQSGLTGTIQQISGLSNSTQYYWRVNATNIYGTSGWSSIWNITIRPETAPMVPTLSSPSNGATNIALPPTLIWSSSLGADGYTLQVSTSDQFTSFVYNQSGLTGTSQQISGLSNSTQYYWRVNATNIYGTSVWSSVWEFTTVSSTGGGDPCPGIPVVIYEGKTYNTVLIGTQCWLKENLDVGTMIQGSQSASYNGTIEKYCYDNDTSNCNISGGLYQWDEMMQYSLAPGVQGICPDGWHIPTEDEFQSLAATVNNDGNALKAIGQGTGGGAGTNTSGFSALSAGYRKTNGNFYDLSNYFDFWSSTEDPSHRAIAMWLRSDNSIISIGSLNQRYGISVRCVMD